MRLTLISNMETKRIEEYSPEEQRELKRFHKSFTVFFVGVIFLIVGTISLSININGVPQILGFLSIFSSIGYLLFFISLFMINKFNRSFTYSFVSICLFLLLGFIVYLCGNSTSLLDNELGRGLSWGKNIAQCVFFLYYFHGCMLFFLKHNLSHGTKQFKLFIIIFASLFILEEIFEYLSTARFIKVVRFWNRFCLYGYWGLIFFVYVFVFVAAILTSKYINKQIEFKKPKKEKNDEQV